MLYPIITAAFSLYTYYSVSKINNARHVFDKTTEEVEDLRIQVGMAITFNKLTTLSQVLALNGFRIYSKQLMISIYESLTHGTTIPTPYIYPKKSIITLENTLILSSTILADLVISNTINDGGNLYKATELYGNFYLDQIKYKLGIIPGWERSVRPLMAAIELGDTEFVQYLVDHGADVNAWRAYSNSPLHKAADYGYTKIVKLLMEQKADTNARNSNGETPLHRAAYKGHVDIIKLLLQSGEGVKSKDAFGNTPLHRATSGRNIEAIKFLIDNGAEIRDTDNSGTTILHMATGCTEAMKIFIEMGLDINAKNSEGYTPLHWAAVGGYTETIKLLIDRGVDIDTKSNLGVTPLQAALPWEKGEAAKLLIDNGAEIDTKDSNGITPLYSAINSGLTEIAKLLIEKGVNIHGEILLHKAIFWRNTEIAKLLIEQGADIDSKNKDNETPLHWAAFGGRLKEIKFLIDNGANVHIKYKQNHSFISSVIEMYTDNEADIANKIDIVESLLRQCMDPNDTDIEGQSPLHVAAARKSLEVIDLLFKYGANPHLTDHAGNVPAAYSSNEEIADFIAKKTAEYDSSYIMYNPFAIFKTQLCLDYDDYCSCRPF